MDQLKQRLLDVWHGMNRVLLTAQLMSGAYDFEPVCGKRVTF